MSNTRPVIPSALSPGVSIKPSDGRANSLTLHNHFFEIDTTHFCSILLLPSLIPRPLPLVCVQFHVVYTECNSNKKNWGDLGMMLILAENKPYPHYKSDRELSFKRLIICQHHHMLHGVEILSWPPGKGLSVLM